MSLIAVCFSSTSSSSRWTTFSYRETSKTSPAENELVHEKNREKKKDQDGKINAGVEGIERAREGEREKQQ